MTSEYKTLRELDVQPGDVVCDMDAYQQTVASISVGGDTIVKFTDGDWYLYDGAEMWRIVSRASDTPKLWRDMTPEEKGALLLAKHEGKVIEVLERNGWMVVSSIGDLDYAYRVRPEPKRETVTLYGSVTDEVWGRGGPTEYDTHRITIDLNGGKPDCDSIKMEEL